MTIVNDHGHKVMSEIRKIPAGEFKARCLKLMEEVKDSGEEILITKRGKPVAKLVPAEAKRKPIFGALAGTAKVKGDIIGPFHDEWRMAED